MGIWKEFNDFLKEYRVTGIAVGFIIGAATTDFAKSVINDLLMPFIGVLVPGQWQEATLFMGPIALRWGAFLSAALNLALIALIVFIIASKLPKLINRKK